MRQHVTPAEGAILAKSFFGLTTPISLEQLKVAYRKKALLLHPDKGGETAAFQAMQDAYHKVSGCSALFEESVVNKYILTTVQGDLLADLGKGLGPMVNAVQCAACDHKGYNVRFEQVDVVCDACDVNGISLATAKCRDCLGVGKVRTRKSKQIVPCRVCKGVGKVRVPRHYNVKNFAEYWKMREDFACHECSGSKRRIMDDELRPIYSTCKDCKGKGEMKIFNPVIPRGRLV